MKQKIVIKVQMACEKCKVKAMSVGAVTEGVNSLAIEGADKDRLVVIGDGVDPAKLTCKLRKKLCCYVTLLSVEEVKPPKPPTEPPKKQANPASKPSDKPDPTSSSCSCSSQFAICHCHQYYPPCPKYCEVVCVENPSYCSIL